jgi:diacylglycerol kinase (ATP)
LKFALILNPGAGSAGDDTASSLRRGAEKQGLEYKIFSGDDPAEAAKKAIEDGHRTLVASGGDGTVGAVAAAILSSDTPDLRLGIVPLGTGNFIAAALGIPTDLDEAFATLAQPKEKPLDVGFANGKPFLIGAGLGVAEEFIRRTDDDQKSLLGRLAYVFGLLRTDRGRRFRLELTHDGQTMSRVATSVVVGNIWSAERLSAIECAADDDGVFEAVIHHRLTWRDVLETAWFAMRGDIAKTRAATVVTGSSFEVRTNPPLPVQLDGNDAEFLTPVTIDVGHRRLTVLVTNHDE